ncbi:perilipin 6 [Denticeps clupeoides]|uniref:Perilipin 6 n=1 Tax=Denticeps clupeoides TaxID=299321 RepID=A0AAY4D0Q0_9TELE|nr:perilipin-1-like [Denticeps clupeoides]
MSDSFHQNNKGNIIWRVAHLPLFSSTLQRVNLVYRGIKEQYPVLGVMGGIAELGVKTVSEAAAFRAAPLLESWEPQLETANTYACVGLDQLEKRFPFLNQSTEEVTSHLKDALLLTLDDVQLRMNEGLDVVLGRWEQVVEQSLDFLRAVQSSSVGRVVMSGLDEALTRSEEAVTRYLPITPEMQEEWDMRMQQYEDENEDEEPGLWMRVHCLLLCLSLHLYHTALSLTERLNTVLQTLGVAAESVGLTWLVDVVMTLLQNLLAFYVSQVHRLEALRTLAMNRLSAQAQVLLNTQPVQNVVNLPSQVMVVVGDLQELGSILIQLVINTTPLYNMIEQPSEQELLDYLSQEELSQESPCHSSPNSLFLKAMDGRPRRRRSLYNRSRQGSSDTPPPTSPATLNPASNCSEIMKPEGQSEDDTPTMPSTSMIRRRSSATEVLMAPIMQLVSQSQRAFEYLSSTQHQEEPVIPVEETTEDESREI